MRLVLAFFIVLSSATAARAADVTPPLISHTQVGEVPENQAFLVRATIEDDSAVFAPAVYVRQSGTDDFVSLAMAAKGGGLFVATVPQEMVSGILEYFIEAFDELGNGPSRSGTPSAPFRVRTFDPNAAPPPAVTTLPPPSDPEPSSAGTLVTAPSEDDDEGGTVFGEWWFWTLVGVAVAGGAAAAVIAVSDSSSGTAQLQVTGPDPSGATF